MVQGLSKSKFLFTGSVVVSSLLAWRALGTTFLLADRNEEYTHILLILPVVVVLVFLEWPRRRASLRARNTSPAAPQSVAIAESIPARAMPSTATDSTPVAVFGVSILLFSIFLAVCAGWVFTQLPVDQRLTLEMLALITWWIGTFVLCFGAQVSRNLLFPLGFLLWLVPFPFFVLSWVVTALQYGSAYAARILFALFRVPVAQDGVFLTIPGVTLEVATECSSIRSSLMLLVTTMVLAHLLLRSPWRKALIVVLVIPLSIAKNGLRIFTLGMLGTRVDPGYLTGRLHHQGGIVFFSIALATIAVLLWLMQRAERRPVQV